MTKIENVTMGTWLSKWWKGPKTYASDSGRMDIRVVPGDSLYPVAENWLKERGSEVPTGSLIVTYRKEREID